MTFLSLQKINGVITCVKSNVVDKFSSFVQTGIFFNIDGIACGFQGYIVGLPAPNRHVNFNQVVNSTPVDLVYLIETGRIQDNGDGTVSIVWPL